jgi:hypothetical protein
MMNYYVYEYRDPSRDNEPFYVGKGKGGRDRSHLKNLDNRKNLPFYNRLAKMRRCGIEPSVFRIAEGLTQDAAFILEMQMIEKYRRRHEGGTLLNITAGGPGFSSPTPITSDGRERIAWNRGIPQTPEVKAKLATAVAGFRHTDEAKAKIAARSAGAKNPGAKRWALIDPNGNEHLVISLRTFCEERGLSERSFRANKNSQKVIAKGLSKGWSVSSHGPLPSA